MADMTAMTETERKTEPKHFRLRDLPDELQAKIYQKYFEGTKLILTTYDPASGKLKFKGIPSLNLELVSHYAHSEATKARSQMTDDILVVSDVHILHNEGFALFVDDPRYSWVRNHIQKLQFKETRSPCFGRVDWKPLIARCAQLQEVDVWTTGGRRTMPFRIADAQCAGSFSPTPSKDVAQGDMRRILADDQMPAQTIGLFSPGSLSKLLAQRSARYKATFHDGTIYLDMNGRKLFADVSLRRLQAQCNSSNRASSQHIEAFYGSKAPSTKRTLMILDPMSKSWFDELDKAGEAEAFRKRGGLIIG